MPSLSIVNQAHAFLLKGLPAEQWGEKGIGIDVQQIVEILGKRTGRKVDGLVRIGHGVHVGVDARFVQGDEGVVDRITARTAQGAVLEDVGDTGIVLRKGAEDKAEKLLVVPVLHKTDFHAAGMDETISDCLIFCKRPYLLQREMGDTVANSWLIHIA